MKRFFWCALSLILAVLLAVPPVPAQAPQQLSDKDKKDLAEIAARPDVQLRIQQAWEDLRRQDMEFAYNVNTSTRVGELVGPQWVEFRTKFGQLYDNPMLQQYVNALGQRLVPKDSPNLFAFRLLLDPMPRAEALSTGTVYISTGLVASLDNEAQLSYVLAHEIAHIVRNHFYIKIRDEILEDELAKKKQTSTARKRGLFALGATVAGGVIGGAAGGASGAAIGVGAGVLGGLVVGQLLFRNRFVPTEWDKVLEDEADEAGVKYILQQNYDAREIPRLYARLDKEVSRDARVGLGFIGSPQRVKERTAHIRSLLAGAHKADLDAKVQAGGLTISGPNFSLLLSALKRDNGIIAMDYDLLAMAKDNLEEAVSQRTNDPRVHHYLGKLLATTGRTPEEKQQAIQYFARAIQYDAQRGAQVEPHLDTALFLLGQNDPNRQKEVMRELKTYVALYQRQNAGRVPNNMHILYDYADLVGETSWYVPPAMVISTKNVDALYVMPVGGKPSTGVADVVRNATDGDVRSPALWPPAQTSAAKPAATKTSAPERKPNPQN